MNEYDQLLFRYVGPMLHQGERILFMGVARNDANLAGQVALGVLIGMKITPKMYFVVATDHKVVALECPGFKFSGGPQPEVKGPPIVFEYRATRIKSIGTTALGGKDLVLETQAGEQRLNIVSSMANVGSSAGPSLQGQCYGEFIPFLQAMYQEGFARIGQVPDVNARFAMMQQQAQRIAAHRQWQDSRKKNGKRMAISAVSIVLMIAGAISVVAVGLMAMMWNRYHPVRVPDAASIARADKATRNLVIAVAIAVPLWAVAIYTRVRASRLPVYLDEIPPAASQAGAGSSNLRG